MKHRKRTDSVVCKQLLVKNKTLQLVKEMQPLCSFVYFYLMVSTIKYKQESEIDLKKSMEVTLNRITRSAKYDCKTRGF
jgi:hypothetical protein